MTSLLLAIQFLTTIPIRVNNLKEERFSSSMAYFPLVGLLLGLLLTGADKLLLFLNMGQFSSSIILVILLIIFTGGLHLDGLSDTADAFFSGKPKEEMLKIMRDSHVGVMGALSLISIILLKISLFFSINASLKAISLILMCVLSRWVLVFSIFSFPYARDEGKAKKFIEGINFKIFILATVIALAITILIWKLKGAIIFVILLLCSYLLNKIISRKIGGITGDTLGAVNELSETIVLLTICFLGRLKI